MEYVLEYTPSVYYSREMRRRILLAFGIILDLLGLGLIFSAVVEPLIWIAVVASFAISITVRMIGNRYPKRYLYGIKDDMFYINEISPAKTTSILNVHISDITAIISADDTYKNAISQDKSIIVLCDNSCQNDIYVLKLRDKSVIIALDEYLYTLIASEIRG